MLEENTVVGFGLELKEIQNAMQFENKIFTSIVCLGSAFRNHDVILLFSVSLSQLRLWSVSDCDISWCSINGKKLM